MEEEKMLKMPEDEEKKPETQGAPEAGPEKTFDEWLNSCKSYQAEFDRRVQKGIATARARWEQEAAAEKDESKKLERMSAEQRRAYELEKREKALEEREKSYAQRELHNATGAELLRRGLDASFADYLTAENAEKTAERIDSFQAIWNQALEEKRNDLMRGKPPKEPAAQRRDDPFLDGFLTGKKKKG